MHASRTWLGALLATALPALGFNGHLAGNESFDLYIPALGPISNSASPQTFSVWATNRSSNPLTVRLEFRDLVPPLSADGPPQLDLTLPAGGAAEGRFRFRVGDGAHSALYPLHVYANSPQGEVHAVQIVELRLPPPSKPPIAAPMAAPSGDPVALVKRMSEARDSLGRADPHGGFLLDLGQGSRACILPGPNGMADAAIAIAAADHAVVFSGIQMSVTGAEWRSGCRVVPDPVPGKPGWVRRLQVLHPVTVKGQEEVVTVLIEPAPGALRLKTSSGAAIMDLALGPADRTAKRVYYGHGYCIENPGPFRAGGGGHNLATSHVGFEFADGPALLVACDTPPDYLQVNPAQRLYALHTHPDATFTLVPSALNAFDAALRYRPLYDKSPAPALSQKAGRFVYDLWGGRYADLTRRLSQCFDYGLTNSLVMMHVWQRWGYDYRLPDIFPPLPSLGTLEELQALGRVCDAAGARWGLHDNYIDIYPDATGFNYDQVTFHADGKPRKAWLNEGRDAQSYQFRPDRVRPFLERNLKQIAPALKPSSSFVDVWTSMNAFDYYDQQGNFHSRTETLRLWGESFKLIRDTFGNAPTVSEAGSDQLIGWLEGADCQFMQLVSKPQRFGNLVACSDWSRVPWFDLVNHARFSLHGVGYSDRYQGVMPRDSHGIESDDYLSAEILTGHDLMIDNQGMIRGAVRKYWLAQRFIQSLALDDIASVQFAEGDMHRLDIRWNSGARVRVNRGTNDWVLENRVLPPMGYLAQQGAVESSIERIDGVTVEQSRAPGERYFNGRGYLKDAPLLIEPEAEALERTGDRQFRLLVRWNAQRPADKDLTVFYHFSRTIPGRRTPLEFVSGGSPARPTSQWQGSYITGSNWTAHVPSGMPAGEYDVLVGLYDSKGDQHRRRLLGLEMPNQRYLLGKLKIETSVANGATNVTGLVFTKSTETPPAVRLPNLKPVDFGPVRTTDGLRITTAANGITFTALPEGIAFDVEADLTRLAGSPVSGRTLEILDARGNVVRTEVAVLDGNRLRLKLQPEIFAYRLRLKE